jgi:hypothetical protein
MESVTYDPENLELRSCWPFFADWSAPTAPVNIQWIANIDTIAITPGMVVGQWIFSSPASPPLDIVAPAGCDGFISARNHGIAFNLLQSPPSQVLFVLKR